MRGFRTKKCETTGLSNVAGKSCGMEPTFMQSFLSELCLAGAKTHQVSFVERNFDGISDVVIVLVRICSE